MELGPPVPDIPLWEPSAAVTPVTAISTRVMGQVAQSVVEVSSLTFLPVPSGQVYHECVPTDMLTDTPSERRITERRIYRTPNY